MAFADYLTVEWAPADTPLDATPTWVDITDKVRSCDIEAGARSTQDSFGIGRAVFEVNNEVKTTAAWLDVDTWYKGRQIRVSTATATLFHGWIRAVEHDVNLAPDVSTARIEAIDVVGLLSEASGDGAFRDWWGSTAITDAQNGAVIDGESGFVIDFTFDDPLTWIADSASLSTSTVNTARVAVFVPETQNGANLSGLQPYLDAECFAFLASNPASNPFQIIGYGRYHAFVIAAASSTCTLTDAGGNYKYLRGSLRLAAPDETYVDRAVIGGKGFDPQTVSDVPSGWTPTAITRLADSPLVDRNWAAANAALLVAIGSQTNTYPRELTCMVAGPMATSVDASHPAVVSTIPGKDAFTVVYDGTTYKVRVISIRHRIAVDEGWKVTFGFSSLDRYSSAYTSTTLFTLGTSALDGSHILAP